MSAFEGGRDLDMLDEITGAVTQPRRRGRGWLRAIRAIEIAAECACGLFFAAVALVVGAMVFGVIDPLWGLL